MRDQCPCGSGLPLSACCGVYLASPGSAPTAEALMRSRYSAFVLGDAEYLLETWDPEQRPARLSLKHDATEWRGLEIISREAGGVADDTGRVKFIARFRLHGRDQTLREHSRFRKQGGRWLYIDGQVEPSSPPVVRTPAVAGRNDPCPCGSGQKFKRCCGK
ncbi:MAG TPA: YchJ family protein [Pseudomonadota bacterium]|nr:YchJ family protein [Pseudomonadota bacterium]